MNKAKYTKNIICEYSSIGLTDKEVEHLLGIYKNLMEKMDAIQARRAWFQTRDLSCNAEAEFDGFDVSVERRTFHFDEKGGHCWVGEFTCGNLRLDVMGRSASEEKS